MPGQKQAIVGAAAAIRAAMAAEPKLSDGRRERSIESRRKIIMATIDLVATGDPNPSAAAVAAKAGVGLRTVFRHFDDKEAMLREIDDRLMRVYQPVFKAPYASAHWRAQLDELIERRCGVYESVVVFRLSGILARYRSPFLIEQSRVLHAAEKRLLDDLLPEPLRTNTGPGRAIMVATSFDSWRFLRQDEELSAADTATAIKQMASDVIAQAGMAQ